jgi:hypothetical protein
MKQIKIEGDKELIKKLGKVEGNKIFKGFMTIIGEEIKGKTSQYPQSTTANSSSNPLGRWYERGYGTKYITKSGIRGKRTSETLSKRWYTKIGDKSAEIGNSASYARWVQGKEFQTRFHKERGWKTLEDTAEKSAPDIEQKIKQQVDQLLN